MRDRPCEHLNITAADALMGIFGFRRVMPDITLCLGINCRVRKSCGRYGVSGDPKWQSYMAKCVDKIAFKGKKRKPRFRF